MGGCQSRGRRRRRREARGGYVCGNEAGQRLSLKAKHRHIALAERNLIPGVARAHIPLHSGEWQGLPRTPAVWLRRKWVARVGLGGTCCTSEYGECHAAREQCPGKDPVLV